MTSPRCPFCDAETHWHDRQWDDNRRAAYCSDDCVIARLRLGWTHQGYVPEIEVKPLRLVGLWVSSERRVSFEGVGV